MDKLNRNHFLTIIDNLLTSFFKSFLPLAIILFSKGANKSKHFSDIRVKLLIILAVLILIAAYNVIKWYKYTYCIKDNLIILSEGVLFTKHKEIPFDKIQTIDISQKIKHRIFNLAIVKVDTGNSSSKEAELTLIIDKEKAEAFKISIINIRKEDSQENLEEATNGQASTTTTAEDKSLPEESSTCYKEVKASKKDLFLSAVTTNNLFVGIIFLGSVYAFVDDYLKDFFTGKLHSTTDPLKNISINNIPTSTIVLWTLVIILIYLAFSVTVSIIKTFVKYNDFTVRRENANLLITYGLFEKKSLTLPVNKISAVYLKQNIIRQIFNLRAIHIETIGYGNESGESSMLYPLTSGLRHHEIIEELLPEFSFIETLTKVPRHSFGRFIKIKFIFNMIISILLTIKFKYGFLYFIIVPISLLNGCLQYKNSAIGKNSNLICLCNKGFGKVTSLVPIDKLQSIVTKNNCFQKRKSLFNVEISIQGNTFGTEIKVKNLSSELRAELENII